MSARLLQFLYRTINRLTPCDVTHVLLLDLKASQILEPDPALSIRKLSESEVASLARDEEQNQISESIATDMKTQQIDFYAAYRNSDELAGYLLAGQGDIPAYHNSGGTPLHGIGLSLPQNVSYIFKCFVLPNMRGAGVLTHLLEAVKAELVAGGTTHLITTTDWTNTPALRSFERAGFERCGLAGEWLPLGMLLRLPSPVAIGEGPHLYHLPKARRLSDDRQIEFRRGIKAS